LRICSFRSSRAKEPSRGGCPIIERSSAGNRVLVPGFRASRRNMILARMTTTRAQCRISVNDRSNQKAQMRAHYCPSVIRYAVLVNFSAKHTCGASVLANSERAFLHCMLTNGDAIPNTEKQGTRLHRNSRGYVKWSRTPSPLCLDACQRVAVDRLWPSLGLSAIVSSRLFLHKPKNIAGLVSKRKVRMSIIASTGCINWLHQLVALLSHHYLSPIDCVSKHITPHRCRIFVALKPCSLTA